MSNINPHPNPKNLIISNFSFSKVSIQSQAHGQKIASQPNDNPQNTYRAINRQRTYSTMLGSNYVYKEKTNSNNNMSENQSLQFPFSSDGDTVSNQARYISYMDFDHQNHSHSDQGSSCSSSKKEQNQQRLRLLYRAIIYLRKEQMRSEIDDCLFLQELCKHIKMGTSPAPISQIGEKLFENGFFLASLAVLKARLHSSPFLLGFLFNYFASNFEIVENQFEFKQYAERLPDSYNLPRSNISQTNKTRTSTILKRDITKPEIRQCESEDFSYYSSQKI